jgi:5-methylcytosine-specific restriction endonuclease McrA
MRDHCKKCGDFISKTKEHVCKTSSWNKGKKVGTSPKKGTKLSKEIRLKTTGENHYNWKGGKYSLNMRIRKCHEYHHWVQDVLKRDDYTCQECGIRGGKLQVHHIKQFALVVKENKISCLQEALDCNELWDYDNAMTLCIPCHKKTDTYLKMV